MPPETRVVATSGSGDVVADGLQSRRSVALSSGSGDVVVDLSHPVSELRATSGSGDIVLTLPDLTYALQASAPDGGLFNDGVRVDSRSPRRLDVESGSGEVRLVPSG